MSTDPLKPRGIARAFANIALVKYWGKRDSALNLPRTGSLSLTLDPLATFTEVTVDPELTEDTLELNGVPADAKTTARVSGFVDLLRSSVVTTARAASGEGPRVRVRSRNTFPTAAGLASSASSFAALTLATAQAFGHDLDTATLSLLARRGSGSAARSIFGGFAEMSPGTRDDGADAVARPLFDPDHWDLSVVIGVIQKGPKKVGSTLGMDHTVATSPYFEPWADSVPPDLAAARAAIEARDFELLTHVAERSCLRMHASAIAADPGVIYWRGVTIDAVHAVREWRDGGLPVFFTIDAGPNIKVFCPSAHAAEVSQRLLDIPGIDDTLLCRPGGGTVRVDTFEP